VKWLDKHIILIGFKHVGKSIIGKLLAQHLREKHIDLDRAIEDFYQEQYQKINNCREIVQNQGEDFFRNLEHETLKKIIKDAPCIISLGGGTPMRIENRELMVSHCIVHLTAEPKQVFARIMRKGHPAFFPKDKDPWDTFNHLWYEREKVYKDLATFSVANQASIKWTVKELLEKFEK
jgi:shikimate kinase